MNNSTDSSPFALSHTLEGTTGTLLLSGELDASSAPRVDEAVDLLVSDGARNLVIDLAEVTFIDSSGLRSLIRARKNLGEDDAVQLRSPQVGTIRLLEITGLTDQFPIA
jgi:anti-anti-sigma factor